MSARHTPGPWTVDWPEEDGSLAMIEGPIVRGAEGQPVAEVLSIGLDASSGHYDVHADADARLIAAAPDLLEVAQEAEDLLAYYGYDMTGEEQALYDRLRAAIARATGQEAPHG